MPIEIFWHRDLEHVQVYRVFEEWTLDDIYAALKSGFLMSHELEDCVIIYDMRQAQGIPNNFLSALSQMNRLHQSNVTLRIVVTANSLVRNLATLVIKVQPNLGQKIVFVETMEQALDRIQQVRSQS